MISPSPTMKYGTAVSLFLTGIALLLMPRPTGPLAPLLYSLALVLLALIQRNVAPKAIWLGLAFALLGSWSAPVISRLLSPLLPPATLAYLIPSAITLGFFIVGNALIGLSTNSGGAFKKHSGTLIALGAVLTPFVGSILYAISLAWIGIQLIRGSAQIVGAPPN